MKVVMAMDRRESEVRVRVLVADDHPSVRENLRYLIDSENDLACVGAAKDGPATVQLCQELLPDVLVLDEDMPGADGLRVLKYLRRELPDGVRAEREPLEDLPPRPVAQRVHDSVSIHLP